MQRYGEIMVYGNPFNESAFFFQQKALSFAEIIVFLQKLYK